jgi:hypothetical protein
MSMSPELIKLSQLLRQATEARSVTWGATVDAGAYRVVLDTGLVSVARAEKEGETTYRLDYRNRDGVLVLDSGWTEAGGTSLARLYDLVHETYKEGSVRSLFQELEQRMSKAKAG